MGAARQRRSRTDRLRRFRLHICVTLPRPQFAGAAGPAAAAAAWQRLVPFLLGFVPPCIQHSLVSMLILVRRSCTFGSCGRGVAAAGALPGGRRRPAARLAAARGGAARGARSRSPPAAAAVAAARLPGAAGRSSCRTKFRYQQHQTSLWATTLPGSRSLRRKGNAGCENAQSVIKSFRQRTRAARSDQAAPSVASALALHTNSELRNTARRHSQACHLFVHLLKVKLLAGVQAEARARAGDGMTGGGPDPAPALRLLLRFDRLPEAARLALAFLDVWDCQVGLVRDSNVGFLGVSKTTGGLPDLSALQCRAASRRQLGFGKQGASLSAGKCNNT